MQPLYSAQPISMNIPLEYVGNRSNRVTMEATWMKASELRAVFSYHVAIRRYCLSWLNKRSVFLQSASRFQSTSRCTPLFCFPGITTSSFLIFNLLHEPACILSFVYDCGFWFTTGRQSLGLCRIHPLTRHEAERVARDHRSHAPSSSGLPALPAHPHLPTLFCPASTRHWWVE